MNLSSLHFSHVDEEFKSDRSIRSYEISDSKLNDEKGRVVAEIPRNGEENAICWVEIEGEPRFRWECSPVERNPEGYQTTITEESSGWSHRLEIPIKYHVPEIFIFDDGKTQLRLAKLGKHFGEFFVVDPDGKADEWVAGFDTSFLQMLRIIISLVTLTIWRPKYWEPLTGSSCLDVLSETEQRKAVILNATIRMILDGNDFSNRA